MSVIQVISIGIFMVPAFGLCAIGVVPSLPQHGPEGKAATISPANSTPASRRAPTAGPVWHCDENALCTQDLSAGAWPPPVGLSSIFLSPTAVEPGFPVQCAHNGGSYHAGPAVHTLVDDLDGDGYPEILVTALAVGPLYAWNHDGTPLSGWPVPGVGGAGYPAMGNLAGGKEALEVHSGHWGTPGKMCAYTGGGASLAGWPFSSANYVASPPALVDIDGDGLDEMFLEEENWEMHAYRADGYPLPGWPVYQPVGGQERHTPAFADLDGDGDIEILAASGWTSPGIYILAYHQDGSVVSGFPLQSNGFTDTYLALGDVDADRRPEIVAVLRESASPWRPIATVLSANGAVEHSWFCFGSFSYGTAPALVDLDGDAFPEIVIQTDSTLEAFKGDGTSLPGWPVSWSGRWLGNSAPVIGDVDGDQLPDIVITTQQSGSSVYGDVRAFNRSGAPLPGFPIALNIGPGAVPAIADMDLDARNEIIVSGSYWNGTTGTYDKVWAFDLGGANHGAIQWGQFGGNSRHNGYFTSNVILRLSGTVLSWTSADAASGYDLSRGDLNILLSSLGDFALATQECLSNDQPERAFDYSDAPGPGEGWWFLVRPVTPLSHGTYDSEGVSQIGGRDAEIAASGLDCP